jgi:DNA-binding XRE family transcriptional regulator
MTNELTGEKGYKMSDFQKHLKERMQDPTFDAEYDALEAQYVFAKLVIAARIQQGFTQAELVARVGTSQANISKLEHGGLNPSLEMAQRIADGLGKKLTVSLS